MDELMPSNRVLRPTTGNTTEVSRAGRAMPPIACRHFIAALQAAEVALAKLLCLVFLIGATGGLEPGWLALAKAALACIALATAVVSVHQSFGAYDFGLTLRPLPSVATSIAAWSVFLIPLWLLRIEGGLDNVSGPDPTLWRLGGVVGAAVGVRLVFAVVGMRLHRLMLLGENIAIVSMAAEADVCVAAVARRSPGATVCGYFVPNGAPEGPMRSGALPLLGHLSDVPEFLQQSRVDEVVAALPAGDTQRLRLIEQYLCCLPARLSLGILPEGGEAGGERYDPERISLVPLRTRPLLGWAWLYKDLQDRVLALLAIMAFTPLMLAIALGIRISSPGKVLFRQVRRGYAGREFEILKFRTMHASVSNSAPERLRLTARGDRRIFWFGKILRKTSLDELPQLFNVLLGDMWLVGPRPHPPFACAAGRLYADVVENYAARHWVKPGITGWAQVNGWRGPTETSEQIRQRVAHDLYYIENWSVGLDWRILLRTATHGFVHENAF